MAHEITSVDAVGMRQAGAWHGLGQVWEGEKTAQQAVAEFLPWQVLETTRVTGLIAPDGDGHFLIRDNNNKMLVRSDTMESLAVVGKGYTVIQNQDIADLADAICDVSGNALHVESVGSIGGGRKVWLQLRGQPYEPVAGDFVHPYFLLASGHDGSMGLVAKPGTIRVVCNNTLHWAIGNSRSTLSIRHSGQIVDKLDYAKRLLANLMSAQQQIRVASEQLVSKTMNRQQIQEFWTSVYEATVGPIPTEQQAAANPLGEARRDKAVQAMRSLSNRFDRERDMLRQMPTAWLALNSWTYWVQHERQIRATESRRFEASVQQDLFGVGERMKQVGQKMAMQIS